MKHFTVVCECGSSLGDFDDLLEVTDLIIIHRCPELRSETGAVLRGKRVSGKVTYTCNFCNASIETGPDVWDSQGRSSKEAAAFDRDWENLHSHSTSLKEVN